MMSHSWYACLFRKINFGHLFKEATGQPIKEYVAFFINIGPWQDPMQFGIKSKVTPCDTPGCIRYCNYLYVWLFTLGKLMEGLGVYPLGKLMFLSCGNKYQHAKLHHCSYITLLNLQHILSAISVISITVLILFCETTFICTNRWVILAFCNILCCQFFNSIQFN